MKFEKQIEVVSPGTNLVDLVSQATDLSKQKTKAALSKGAVWLKTDTKTDNSVRRVRRADRRLDPGQIVYVYYDESILETKPPAATLLTDEDNYSIWHKPYGMLSQGSKWGDHCTLSRWAEKHLQPQRPAFTVHRLDRAASGLMVIAHSKKVAAALAEQFQQRKVEKRYRALVKGQLVEPLTIDQDIDGQSALTEVTPLEYSQKRNISLVDVGIKTGRKHQIRKHLSQANFPILGDRLYDPDIKDDDPDLCLVAHYLAFHCPTTGERKTYSLPESLIPTISLA